MAITSIGELKLASSSRKFNVTKSSQVSSQAFSQFAASLKQDQYNAVYDHEPEASRGRFASMYYYVSNEVRSDVWRKEHVAKFSNDTPEDCLLDEGYTNTMSLRMQLSDQIELGYLNLSFGLARNPLLECDKAHFLSKYFSRLSCYNS